MEHVVIFIYLGIAIVMVIAAIILGRRKQNPDFHHDTTNASDLNDFGTDNTNSDLLHGHADQGSGSDSSLGN